MAKEQFDLFEQPPPNLARGHSAEEVSRVEFVPKPGHKFYQAGQELVHFTDYLKLNDWQQAILWPHLRVLLQRLENATEESVMWFELGYIVSAMEIEQVRSRDAARKICAKYDVKI